MASNQKTVHLALQGGGAHGAFAWGILDKILEDGRLHIDGLSATSAGAMNATAFAYGRLKGGNDGAREMLQLFWQKVSQIEHKIAEFPMPIIDLFARYSGHNFFDGISRVVSPYQFNLSNYNPLKKVLEELIDFEELKQDKLTNLFITTTNVCSGKVRVFDSTELSADVVIASAALPYLFQATKIGNHHYWDGGYTGNPAVFPLFYYGETRDVIIVHINPIIRDKLPINADEISNRINEITFNCPLQHELRAIEFVNKMLDNDWIKDEYKHKLRRILVHSIRADEALKVFDIASKFDTHWYFLTYLRDLGRETAEIWLAKNFGDIGKKSTADLRKDFLDDKYD